MDYDLIVLGAGSGGMASAVRAAKYGAKVAVVECAHPGGTCVNLGCVPKKVMFNAASIKNHMEKAVDYGFERPEISLDWATLVQRRESYIKNLRSMYLKRFDQYDMTLLEGEGCLLRPHTVGVNQREYTAKHIIIATGGIPVMPTSIKGIEHAIDSDGFFALEKKPEKVALVGSGYIGVEIACLLNGLGVDVHLMMRGQTPLRRFDHSLSDMLMEVMRNEGIHIHTDYQAASIEKDAHNKKTIHCRKGSTLTDFNEVIMAIGRRPRTDALHLDACGIHTNDKGLIDVDAYQNTSATGIYAIGDVTDAPALTPVAIAAGRKLCDRLFNNKDDAKLDYNNICTVVFTHPPIGTVGLSEKDARERFGEANIRVYQSRFNPMFDALSAEKTPTLMKLIVAGPEERIIGLHIIGYHSDEMLQGFGVAIKMGATKKDFDQTVAIHPTSAEELVTMV